MARRCFHAGGLHSRRYRPTSVVALSVLSLVLLAANNRLFAQSTVKEGSLATEPQRQTFRWRVTEYGTDKPVADATVRLRRTQVLDVTALEVRELSVEEVTTDADGDYSFSLDLLSQDVSNQGLGVSVSHPNYVPTSGDYRYWLSLDRQLKSYRADKPVGLETVRLHPAREVQGVLLAPDGQAAANVAIKGLTRLSESTKVPTKDQFQSQVISKTDEQGRFRLLVAATGTARFWFFPTDNAPRGLVVDETTTDAGVVTLESGFRPQGRIVDVDGKPVAAMTVFAKRLTREVGDNGGPSFYERSAVTDSDGRFRFDPLGAATYLVGVHPNPVVAKRTVYPGIFVDGERAILSDAEEIALQAVPTVDIRLTTLNSSREPAAPLRFNVTARDEDLRRATGGTSLRPEKGISTLKIPKGLRQVRLSLGGLPDIALLLKRDAGGLYEVNPRGVTFDRIDQDLDLEIIRFQPTVVRVKVTDASGKELPDIRPVGVIRAKELVDGQVDVEFYKDQSGSWRSQPLIAIGELTVTAESATAGSASQSVTVVEGDEKIIILMLGGSRE